MAVMEQRFTAHPAVGLDTDADGPRTLVFGWRGAGTSL
jgi:hypothetical protein